MANQEAWLVAKQRLLYNKGYVKYLLRAGVSVRSGLTGLYPVDASDERPRRRFCQSSRSIKRLMRSAHLPSSIKQALADRNSKCSCASMCWARWHRFPTRNDGGIAVLRCSVACLRLVCQAFKLSSKQGAVLRALALGI